jgi:hypothetical protein
MAKDVIDCSSPCFAETLSLRSGGINSPGRSFHAGQPVQNIPVVAAPITKWRQLGTGPFGP